MYFVKKLLRRRFAAGEPLAMSLLVLLRTYIAVLIIKNIPTL
jgi:hypothetical protein